MKIFCKKCGNIQDKTPDDLIGEFCICDYCGALFTWYKKNGLPVNGNAERDHSKEK